MFLKSWSTAGPEDDDEVEEDTCIRYVVSSRLFAQEKEEAFLLMLKGVLLARREQRQKKEQHQQRERVGVTMAGAMDGESLAEFISKQGHGVPLDKGAIDRVLLLLVRMSDKSVEFTTASLVLNLLLMGSVPSSSTLLAVVAELMIKLSDDATRTLLSDPACVSSLEDLAKSMVLIHRGNMMVGPGPVPKDRMRHAIIQADACLWFLATLARRKIGSSSFWTTFVLPEAVLWFGEHVFAHDVFDCGSYQSTLVSAVAAAAALGLETKFHPVSGLFSCVYFIITRSKEAAELNDQMASELLRMMAAASGLSCWKAVRCSADPATCAADMRLDRGVVSMRSWFAAAVTTILHQRVSLVAALPSETEAALFHLLVGLGSPDNNDHVSSRACHWTLRALRNIFLGRKSCDKEILECETNWEHLCLLLSAHPLPWGETEDTVSALSIVFHTLRLIRVLCKNDPRVATMCRQSGMCMVLGSLACSLRSEDCIPLPSQPVAISSALDRQVGTDLHL